MCDCIIIPTVPIEGSVPRGVRALPSTARINSVFLLTMTDETQPLLSRAENGIQPPPSRPFMGRTFAVLNSEGEPSFIDSFRWFFLQSWVNTLLVFIPLSFISHHSNWDAALRFIFSFIAIVPLAKVTLQSRHGPCRVLIPK